jgi:hypothetical protein
MPYTAQISRVNPACILILVDQSGSMKEPFGNTPDVTKDKVVADAVNRLIQNIVLRSAKADGVRDYFHVGVLGYGQTLNTLYGGRVPFDILRPISQVGMAPLRVEERVNIDFDNQGNKFESKVMFPVWYEAKASGKTPMVEAVGAAVLAITSFVELFPNAFPPIVLNLTDGIPTDGNPQEMAKTLRALKTNDGNVLMFNLLLASIPSAPNYFLGDENLLTDKFSKLLFRMSSLLPQKVLDAARNEGFRLDPNARGVVFNADPTAVVRFLDIGTRIGTGVK